MESAPSAAPNDAAEGVLSAPNSIAHVIRQKRGDPTHVELEGRLGHMNAYGAFVAGVSASQWNAIVDALAACTSWKRVTPMYQRHDFFFRNVRLSHEWSDDHAHAPVTVRKERLAMCNVELGGVPNAPSMVLRIAASRERPIALRSEMTGEAFALDMPERVRVKQTQSWETLSGWRFDASRVWEADTLTRALEMITEIEPIYEVELELADPQYLNTHSDTHTADSLIMKMRDLCVTNDGRVLAVHPAMEASDSAAATAAKR